MLKTSIVDDYKAGIRGSTWRKARNKHILIEPFCQCCGREKNLEVHHVKPWSDAPELRVAPSNLITLCRQCHFRFGHHSYWKDSNPFIREDCIRFRQCNLVRAKRFYNK